MDESIFIKCDCGCNILEFSYDEEFKQFDVSLWVKHPGNLPLSKQERIRWCDHVMKTGKPWADHTIVTSKNAQRLITFLTKHKNPYGKKKKSRKSNDIR